RIVEHYMHLFRDLLPLLAVGLFLCVTGSVFASPEATERAKKFIAGHDTRIRSLDVSANLAWWNANISGKDEDFKKKEEAQNKIDEALADKAAFAELKQLKQANGQKQIDDRLLARGVDILYLQYLEKQVDPALLKQMVAKSNAV